MYRNICSIYNGRMYIFNPLFGFLRSTVMHGNTAECIDLGGKGNSAFKIVINPYNVNPRDVLFTKHLNIPFWTKWYAKFLVFSYKHFYPLFYLCSHLRLNAFENSITAINVFCSIIPKNQKILCLPRSVFAATTSRKFKNNGAMFIGVFHPSRHMHAWIIEDNCNPCSFDNNWINFTPISIMV